MAPSELTGLGLEICGTAHDPLTGDICKVWEPFKDRSIKAYSINGGPSTLVPTLLAVIHQNKPARIAVLLLRQYQSIGKPCDAEELTLP